MSNSVASRLGEFVRPTGEETRLDISFPDQPPRIAIGTRTAIIAAGVLAVIVGLMLSHLLFRTGDGALARSAPAASAPAAVAPEAAASGGTIVVSGVGAVVVQGLVTLEPGARVADAIAAAGGLLEGADPAALNQAQLLVDGQQIVVPAVGAAPAPPAGGAGAAGAAGSAAGGMVSLNSADAAGLSTLDGVGEATAAAIIEFREQNGGFTSIEQLMDVSGIGPAKFEAIKDHVTL